MCTQMVWKHRKTTRKRNKNTMFLYGWIRSVWSKSHSKNISLTIFLCMCWKEMCVCEGFYICQSAFRETGGGRKYCWMVKRCVCASLFLCLLVRKKERGGQRKGKRERERPIHRRRGLQRLNFISSDRLNGRYLHMLCTQSQRLNIFSFKTLQLTLLPADTNLFKGSIPNLNNLFQYTH